MNILLDTNIIIPLEDTGKILDASFAELRKLVAEQQHCLYTIKGSVLLMGLIFRSLERKIIVAHTQNQDRQDHNEVGTTKEVF